LDTVSNPDRVAINSCGDYSSQSVKPSFDAISAKRALAKAEFTF
jgi:hypothetical protein